MIRKTIKYKRRKDLKRIDKRIKTIGITLEEIKKHKNITIVGVQKTRYQIKKGMWTKLMKKVQQEEKVIVMGNYNAHYSLWNCEMEDKE